MFHQKQANNTHKKSKSWYYSLGVLALLASGTTVAATPASADILGEITVLSEQTAPAATEAAQAPIEAVVPIEPFRGWEGEISTGFYGTVDVTFEFEDGTTAAPSVRYDNTSGVYPEYQVPQIPGYTASQQVIPEMDPNTDNVYVKIVYTKNTETPSEPAAPETPEVTETPNAVAETPAAPKASILGELDNLSQIETGSIVMEGAPTAVQPAPSTKLTVLPDTGEKTAATAILAGTAAFAVAAILGLATRLKQRKN